MKKILFIIALFMVYPMIAFGENFKIKEYGITMSFDKNWDVFTRESGKNDYFLAKYDLDYDLLQKNLKDNSIYLYALHETDDNVKIEFMTITNGKKVDGNRPMTEEEFKETASILAKKFGADGYEIYESNYKYIKYDYFAENVDLYYTNYLLYIDSIGYFFTARKETPFTDDEITQIKNVIDSIAISGDGIQYVEGVSNPDETQTQESSQQKFIIDFIVKFFLGYIFFSLLWKYVHKKPELMKKLHIKK